VLEIDAADVRGARHVLDTQPFVKSVAQLGTRLHVLLARETSDATVRIRGALRQAGVEAYAEITAATLEDVFVAATTLTRE